MDPAGLPLHILAARQGGIVTREQALAAGLTPRRIRTLVGRDHWQHPHRGLFHTGGPEPDGALPLLAALWAAHLRAGPRSVVGLDSAARALGVRGLPDRSGPVQLVLPASGQARRPTAGLRLHYWPLRAEETTRLGRLPLTTPVRTLTDTLLHLPDADPALGLAILDSALHRRLLTPAELPALAAAAFGRPGAPALRRLLPLADGRAAGPLESRLRRLCLDAGLPPDHLAHPVGDGRVVALAWTRDLARPLFVDTETDGDSDIGSGQRRGRCNEPALPTDAGVLRYTWSDVLDRGGRRVVEEIRTALGRCLSVSGPGGR